MSWHVSPWVYPVWDSLCLLDFKDSFLFHVGEIFNYNLFKNFLIPFLFLFLFWDPCNSNIGVFGIVSEVSRLSSVLFILFTLFCYSEVISTILSSSSLIHSSASDILLLIPSRVFFREGNGTPLQYSCLENSMDGGAWWAAVHGVSKSRTRLNDFTFTFHFHALEKEMATHSSVLAWRIPRTAGPGGLPSLGSQRVGHD